MPDLDPPLQRIADEAERVAPCLRVVEDAAEQATLARARELRAEGRSLRGVAAGLVAEGRRPRGGGEWAIQTIRRLVAAT